jgi:hypothetical protein
MDNAQARAAANDDPSLLSEFGATTDLRVIERQVDRADRAMVSWQWWHYCACDDPTTAGPGDVQAIVSDPARPPEGANVFEDKLRAIVRPYPQAVAGTPLAYGFLRDSRTFLLRYAPRPGVTEVFVPELHYPDGYAVEVTGARVISPVRSRVLMLRNEGSREVSVEVKPGKGAFPRVRAKLRAGRKTGWIRVPDGVDCAGTVRSGRRRAKVGRDCRFRLRTRRRAVVRFSGTDQLKPARVRAR